MDFGNTSKTTLVALLGMGWMLASCGGAATPPEAGGTAVPGARQESYAPLEPISESQFRAALQHPYHADVVTKIQDTTKLEPAYQAISAIYTDFDRELAEHEQCKSPRCLTRFKAYYPALDLYAFTVYDYHYSSACFVHARTNQLASGHRRFRAEEGVMAKDGKWAGLEMQDADSYLQLEIAKPSKQGYVSLQSLDIHGLVIEADEPQPLVWAAKNTIYLAVRLKSGRRETRYFVLRCKD